MNDNIKILKQMIVKILYRMLFIFKVRKNRIFIMNNNGKGYGDSQKYISEEILNRNLNYEIFWAVTTLESDFPKEIHKVKRNSLKYFYYLATSKILINNVRFPLFFVKRKNQFYIQTWHSPLRLKKIELDSSKSLSKYYKKTMKNDSKYIDVMISGCDFSYNIYRRAFLYDGDVLKTGTPRCDILFDNSTNKIYDKVNKNLKLSNNKKIILYAPTFRAKNDINSVMMDVNEIYNKVKDDYQLIVKFHPLEKECVINSDIINASKYPDIQELLCISDILITDYSSCLFDMLIAGKKCILLLKDLDDYLMKERNLYFDIEEIPFPKAFNEAELLNIIYNYDKYYNQKAIDKFKKSIGLYENGDASKKIVSIIQKEIKKGVLK